MKLYESAERLVIQWKIWVIGVAQCLALPKCKAARSATISVNVQRAPTPSSPLRNSLTHMAKLLSSVHLVSNKNLSLVLETSPCLLQIGSVIVSHSVTPYLSVSHASRLLALCVKRATTLITRALALRWIVQLSMSPKNSSTLREAIRPLKIICPTRL